MPMRGRSANNSDQHRTLVPLDKKEGYFDDGTMAKRAKVDPTATLESIISILGPRCRLKLENGTSNELNLLRKNHN